MHDDHGPVIIGGRHRKPRIPEKVKEMRSAQDLQVPGWRDCKGREAAEAMLKGKEAGTYLLREGDQITFSMTFHLEQENLLFIHPYVLTVVVDKNKKFADILLLQTNKGWILYRDDPNLQDADIYRYHPSLETFLHIVEKIYASMADVPGTHLVPLNRG